jgi:purine-cytosine permease-like protein
MFVLKSSKNAIHLNYTQNEVCSSTEKKLRLHVKKLLINIVHGICCCLFQGSYEIHKLFLSKMQRILLMLQGVVPVVTAELLVHYSATRKTLRNLREE